MKRIVIFSTVAPRMTEIPVFDLISLVQSLPTTPGNQSVRAGLLSAIESRDPQTALSMAGDRESDRISVLQQWSQNNPAEALREPDIAAAAMAGAVRLGFNDFEGSCIAVDEVMRRMGLGDTDTERQANWARQPASVTTAFENSQQQLIAQLSSHDPRNALAWAEQWPWAYTNGAPVMNSLRFAYSRWESNGSGQAQDWLGSSKFSEEQRRAIKPQTVYSDPGNVAPVGANTAILPTNATFLFTTPVRGN